MYDNEMKTISKWFIGISNNNVDTKFHSTEKHLVLEARKYSN